MNVGGKNLSKCQNIFAYFATSNGRLVFVIDILESLTFEVIMKFVDDEIFIEDTVLYENVEKQSQKCQEAEELNRTAQTSAKTGPEMTRYNDKITNYRTIKK